MSFTNKDWVIKIQDEIIKGLYEKIERLEKNLVGARTSGMEMHEELLMYKRTLNKIVDLVEETNEY